MSTIRSFFSQAGHFFSFQKSADETSPSPQLVAPLSFHPSLQVYTFGWPRPPSRVHVDTLKRKIHKNITFTNYYTVTCVHAIPDAWSFLGSNSYYAHSHSPRKVKRKYFKHNCLNFGESVNHNKLHFGERWQKDAKLLIK